DGTISGTPAVPGFFTFTVRATDASAPSQTATATLGLTVLMASGSLQVTTASLPGGTIGQSYSAALSAAGGAAPYAWSIGSGALPQGLRLTSAGTIDGTPTAAGTASFTVHVTDAATPQA